MVSIGSVLPLESDEVSNQEVNYEPVTTSPVVVRKCYNNEFSYSKGLSCKGCEVFVTDEIIASLFETATVVDHKTMREMTFKAHLQEDVFAYELNYFAHVGERLWFGGRHDLFWSGVVIYRQRNWEKAFPTVPFRKEYVRLHLKRLNEAFCDFGDRIALCNRYEVIQDEQCVGSFDDLEYVKGAYPNHVIEENPPRLGGLTMKMPHAIENAGFVEPWDILAVYYNKSMKRCALIWKIDDYSFDVAILAEDKALDRMKFNDVFSVMDWLREQYPDISRRDPINLVPYWFKETVVEFDLSEGPYL